MPDMPLSTMTGRFDVIFRLIGAGIIVVGIYLVLQPFLSALLVAGVLAIATWPLYRRIHDSLGGRATWSAALMMLLILVLVVIPIAFLAAAAADQLPGLFATVKRWFAGGVHVPEQLRSIPVVGDRIYDQLTLLVERQGSADRDRAEAARAGRQALGGHRAHARRRHPAVAAGHVHRVLLLPRRPSGRRRDRPHLGTHLGRNERRGPRHHRQHHAQRLHRHRRNGRGAGASRRSSDS